MTTRTWKLAEWEEKETNIKYSGIYPGSSTKELEKKLKELLLKGNIKKYKISKYKWPGQE